jgi:hypothetical protein
MFDRQREPEPEQPTEVDAPGVEGPGRAGRTSQMRYPSLLKNSAAERARGPQTGDVHEVHDLDPRARSRGSSGHSESPAVEVPIPARAPVPPGLLTPEQVYAWWLARLLTGEAEVIETWPRIFLAARSIGLTRLGRRQYTPAGFRRACERLVREGRAIPFWYVARGRPPVAMTTFAHLWSFALAGFHRRLGHRASTVQVRDGLQDRAAPRADAEPRADGSAAEVES